MATNRERPYSQFNFTVNLGIDTKDDYDAGFQEVSNIGMEVTVTEYRNGNEKENAVRKITGLNKATDVTLKRGIIGTETLYKWLDAIRLGKQDQLKTVTISLMSEDHSGPVMQWELERARIIKYVCGPFNGKGTDVAMEEMTLAYEFLKVK